MNGLTAGSKDFIDVTTSRLPIVFGFVLSLAFILLLVTFRSIVVPIKAIVLNLLSVGSAYGVLVLVFQDGHGERLLNFQSVGGIAPWIPLFLFVILFGLSMDYHVLVLSRVREAVDRGMSNDDAVAHGIKSTAGVVTSAALVMVAVFGAFALGSDQVAKQIGVGLAAAILIDATIIRAVLLPASMKLLGDAQLVPAQGPGLAAEVRSTSRRSPPPPPDPATAGARIVPRAGPDSRLALRLALDRCVVPEVALAAAAVDRRGRLGERDRRVRGRIAHLVQADEPVAARAAAFAGLRSAIAGGDPSSVLIVSQNAW